jgi:chromosome segregation ATPase
MTDEEINRKFHVVADHLASLAVGQQRLQEMQGRTEESVRTLLAVTEIQSQEIRELGDGLRELGGAVRVIDERRREAEERQREADERNRETDERLSALINMVERYISERRNGKSQGDDAQG